MQVNLLSRNFINSNVKSQNLQSKPVAQKMASQMNDQVSFSGGSSAKKAGMGAVGFIASALTFFGNPGNIVKEGKLVLQGKTNVENCINNSFKTTAKAGCGGTLLNKNIKILSDSGDTAAKALSACKQSAFFNFKTHACVESTGSLFTNGQWHDTFDCYGR